MHIYIYIHIHTHYTREIHDIPCPYGSPRQILSSNQIAGAGLGPERSGGRLRFWGSWNALGGNRPKEGPKQKGQNKKDQKEKKDKKKRTKTKGPKQKDQKRILRRTKTATRRTKRKQEQFGAPVNRFCFRKDSPKIRPASFWGGFPVSSSKMFSHRKGEPSAYHKTWWRPFNAFWAMVP